MQTIYYNDGQNVTTLISAVAFNFSVVIKSFHGVL